MVCHPCEGHHCPYCGLYHSLRACPVWEEPSCAPAQVTPGVAYWPAYARPVNPEPTPAGPTADEETRALVSERLQSDPRIPPQAHIQVEVRGGVVTLAGTAPDKWSKQAAAEVALSLPQVVDVQNHLQIV